MDCYIYTSYMRKQYSFNELELLMNIFKKNNKDNNLTGCLLYNKGNVIQLFEGEKIKTKELLDKLISDNRHSRYTTLLYKDINKRSFPNWEMELILDNSKQLEIIEIKSIKDYKMKILFDTFKRVCKNS
jgi:hypothetical protein